jgi:hypothetical protein
MKTKPRCFSEARIISRGSSPCSKSSGKSRMDDFRSRFCLKVETPQLGSCSDQVQFIKRVRRRHSEHQKHKRSPEKKNKSSLVSSMVLIGENAPPEPTPIERTQPVCETNEQEAKQKANNFPLINLSSSETGGVKRYVDFFRNAKRIECLAPSFAPSFAPIFDKSLGQLSRSQNNHHHISWAPKLEEQKTEENQSFFTREAFYRQKNEHESRKNFKLTQNNKKNQVSFEDATVLPFPPKNRSPNKINGKASPESQYYFQGKGFSEHCNIKFSTNRKSPVLTKEFFIKKVSSNISLKCT